MRNHEQQEPDNWNEVEAMQAVLRQALDALCLPCDRWNKQQSEIVNAAIAAIREQLGETK